MNDIEKQPFYQKLNVDFKAKVIALITKHNTIAFYEHLQLIGTITFIVAFFIISFIVSRSFNFNSMPFYLCVLTGGGFFAITGKMVEPLKKDYEKQKESIKNKMILDICNCSDYCDCRKQFNKYMESEGIKIIS